MFSTLSKRVVVVESEISSRVKWNWNLGSGISGQSNGTVPFGVSANVNGSKVAISRNKMIIFSFTRGLLLLGGTSVIANFWHRLL